MVRGMTLCAAMLALVAATMTTAPVRAAGATDLFVARFGWRTDAGCPDGPRAVIVLDIGLRGAAPAAPVLELRYRWRKRPGGQWFARTLPVTNRLAAGAGRQRINLYLPVDSSGAVWDFEVVLDPRNRIAEADETNNQARFSGPCGGRGT